MKVIISDCDHASLEIEYNVLNSANVKYELQQNKTEEDLIRNCQEAEIILNQYAPFTERVFKSLSKLKLIVRYGVGVNNIDLNAATKHGVQICNVPDYGIQEVADHALALMLALTRKVILMNTEVKSGNWDYQKSIPIYRHQEQTVGIIGLGRIGSAFATKVRALGMNVIAYDPSKQQEKIKDNLQFVTLKTFEEVLKESDVISIHCPSDQAYHLFNEQTIQLMKRNSYIVNVSRGGIIDETALFKALINGVIAGAALDVSEKEPIEKDTQLLSLEQVICTPHMAWYSEQASQELKRKVAEEAVRFAQGKQIYYPIN